MIKIFNSENELKQFIRHEERFFICYNDIGRSIDKIQNLKSVKFKSSNSIHGVKLSLYIRRIKNKFILIANARCTSNI